MQPAVFRALLSSVATVLVATLPSACHVCHRYEKCGLNVDQHKSRGCRSVARIRLFVVYDYCCSSAQAWKFKHNSKTKEETSPNQSNKNCDNIWEENWLIWPQQRWGAAASITLDARSPVTITTSNAGARLRIQQRFWRSTRDAPAPGWRGSERERWPGTMRPSVNCPSPTRPSEQQSGCLQFKEHGCVLRFWGIYF